MTSWASQIRPPVASRIRPQAAPVRGTIAILTQQADNESCHKLRDALTRKGYQVDLIQYENGETKQRDKANIFEQTWAGTFVKFDNGRKKRLGSYQGVILRTWGAEREGHEALALFEQAGVAPLTDVATARKADSKLATHQAFTDHDVPHPKSMDVHQGQTTWEEIQAFIADMNAPYVIKGDVGSRGNQVIFCETVNDLYHAYQQGALGQDFVLQEYIKTSGPKQQSYRVFVTDDEVVGAMELTADAEGVARTNTSAGGDPVLVNLSPELQQLAVRAAKVMGMSVAGVDIMVSDQGKPYVLESNDSPKISTLVGFGIPAHEAVAASFDAKLQQVAQQRGQVGSAFRG